MIDYGKYTVGMVIMPCYYYLGTIVPGRHNCPSRETLVEAQVISVTSLIGKFHWSIFP